MTAAENTPGRDMATFTPTLAHFHMRPWTDAHLE